MLRVVHDQMPMGLRRAGGQQRREVMRKVLLGTGRAEAVADRAGGDIEIGDEGGRAVADVLELGALDAPRAHRLRRRRPLKCLHPGHLVDAAGFDPDGSALLGALIGLADVSALGGEVGVSGRVDPALGAVGLELHFAQETPYRMWRDALNETFFAGGHGKRGLRPMRERPAALARRLTRQGDDRADIRCQLSCPVSDNYLGRLVVAVL